MKQRAGAAAMLTVLLAARVGRADDTKATGPEGPKRPVIEDAAGTPVTFDSTDYAMRVYLARGDVRDTNIIPDPYEKLPPLPCTVKLAPGTYTAEAESPNASTGHQRFVVEHDAPIKVEVHSGNASVKAFGGVFIGLGVVSTILGIVSIVSISPNDGSFNRWAVGLPLIIGGVGVGGLGIGMTFLGSTEIVAPHRPPGTPASPAAVRGVALNLKF